LNQADDTAMNVKFAITNILIKNYN